MKEMQIQNYIRFHFCLQRPTLRIYPSATEFMNVALQQNPQSPQVYRCNTPDPKAQETFQLGSYRFNIMQNWLLRQSNGISLLSHFGEGSKELMLINGFKKFLIRNEKELEILLTNNRVFTGELAHNLSARKRATLVRRAAELNVRLTNGKGKLRTEEKKE